MTCAQCSATLPDLLLDPASCEAGVADSDLQACAACRDSIAELRATSDLLDAWSAPEPSPWFDARLMARLHDEQAAAPETLFERLRSYLTFSTRRQLRPVLAGALALLLAVGGGTAVSISHLLHPSAVQASATVEDLQIMEKNEQALQAIDQLLQDDASDDGFTSPPAS